MVLEVLPHRSEVERRLLLILLVVVGPPHSEGHLDAARPGGVTGMLRKRMRRVMILRGSSHMIFLVPITGLALRILSPG